jgi:hypothetical protein
MANLFDNNTSNLAQLKSIFMGPIQDLLSQDLPVLRAAEKLTKGWSGSEVIRPLRSSRNQGVGATTELGALPAIGRQGTVRATITARLNFMRFGISGLMIASSKSDSGSFIRSGQWELERGYEDLSNDLNRQYGDNGVGVLATVSANAIASTVISITGRSTGEEAAQFLAAEKVVDIYTSAGVLVAQGLTISAVTATVGALTGTITLNAPVTCSSTDVIVSSGAYNNEIQGLLAAMDGLTTTIYGVNRANVPAYQGNVTNASGAQLSLDRMQAVYNAGLKRGGVKDAQYSAIYCDFDSLRYYQRLLTPDKRYQNTVEGDGAFGKKGKFYLEFNGSNAA